MEKTDAIIQHTPNLWTLDADWQETAFRRRMTVIKTSQGGLIIHSAIALPDSQWKELETLGTVEAIVIPNFFHDSEAPVYAERYPNAQVFTPESLLEKTKKRCPKSRVHSLEQEWSTSSWSQDLHCIPIQGLRMAAESAFVHPSSRTLILCDMAFNMNPNRFQGFERTLMRWNRIGQGFGPSRLATSVFIKNKKVAAKSFQHIEAMDFDRIIINHGDIVDQDGKNVYRRGFLPFLN